MNNIERIIQDIKDKYTARMDSRESGRKKVFKKGSVSIVMNRPLKKSEEPKEFITINHTAVPIEDDGSLGGKIGEKIESTEKVAVESSEKSSEGKDKATEAENASQGNTKPNSVAEKQKRLREEVDNGLKDGRFSREMKRDKQLEHMYDSDEYKQRCNDKKWPSYLTIPIEEVEEIAKKYIDTGAVTVKGSHRVYFEHDKEIGVCVRPNGGKAPVDTTPTKCGEIHLSKDGWHIVPVLKKGGLS